MNNDQIDFHNFKRIKLLNPMFDHCSKAIPVNTFQAHNNYNNESPSKSSTTNISDTKKSYHYIAVDKLAQVSQKIFQCKSICPIFNNDQQSYILVKGQNLWDYYRARKQDEIILTEQQIWLLIKQLSEALLHLVAVGIYHTHIKQHAIYRQSANSYQVIYHPKMKSMLQLSQQNNFNWYNFYLSPQQLNADSELNFIHSQKQTVFSFGLLLLNAMNSQDFNRNVYCKKQYSIDWDIIQCKLSNSKLRFSSQLISLVQNCLKKSPQQRYGLKQLYHHCLNVIRKNKIINNQFKALFQKHINSTQNFSNSSSNNHISTKITNFLESNQLKQKQSKQKIYLYLPDKQNDQKLILLNQQKDKNKSLNQKNQNKHSSSSFSSSSLKFQPKKWNTQSLGGKKTYSISKKKNNQQKIINKQNNEKLMKKEKDIIDFQRGTFGGQKQSQFKPTNFKNQTFTKQILSFTQNDKGQQDKIQLVYKNQLVQKQQQFYQNNLSKIQQNQTQVNTQINFLYQNTKTNHQNIQLQQTYSNNIQNMASNFNTQFISQLINMESKQQLQQLKITAKEFENSKQLIKIKIALQILKQTIKLNINDCLRPLQILQASISDSPGVYINGNLYFGTFKNGRRNGLGLQIFPQNQYYFGQFKDDLFHGQGFYYWNKNQFFLGFFQNGKKLKGNLLGPKINYFGDFINSKKMNGIGQGKFKTGQQYIGQWKNGRRHGIGKLIQITKDVFEGYWLKGRRFGYGQYYSEKYPQQGFKLKAFWRQNDIISETVIQYANGNIYEGTLKDFQKHGKGLFIFKSGGYFKGTFYKDNATHGQLMYKNGQKYIGSLKNMKRNGFGQYHYLDGSIKKGNWIMDIRQQKQTNIQS